MKILLENDLTILAKKTTNDVMEKGIIDNVLKANFERSILDEKENVNIENQIDQLISNSRVFISNHYYLNLWTLIVNQNYLGDFMKKTLLFLTILLFAASAFAEITLSSTHFVRETEKANNGSQTRDMLFEQLANVSAEGGITSQDFEASYDQYDKTALPELYYSMKSHNIPTK